MSDVTAVVTGPQGPPAYAPVREWAPGQNYKKAPYADMVSVLGILYECLITHTAGNDFNTDRDAGKWGVILAALTDDQQSDITSAIVAGETAGTAATSAAASAATAATSASVAVTRAKRYTTLSLANAAIGSMSANDSAEVFNDGTNNGTYYKAGSGDSSLTKMSSATVPALNTRTTDVEAKTDPVGTSTTDVLDREGNHVVGGYQDSQYRDLHHWTDKSYVALNALSIEVYDDAPDGIYYVDANYRCFAKQDASGYAIFGADNVGQAVSGMLADIQHSDGSGQSTINGVQPTGASVVSSTQPYGNLMFVGGVRYSGSESLASLSPAIEAVVSTNGETPMSASVNQTVKLIQSEDGFAYPNQGGVFLASETGLNGASLAQIAKGTAPYTNKMALITAAAGLAQGLNLSYVYTDTLFSQGETDQVNSVSRASRVTALTQYISDLSTDIKATAGQTFEPFFIAFQLASHIYYKNRPSTPNGPATPNISLALRDVANAGNARIAMPDYICDYVDGVHFDAESYRMRGKYAGRLRKRLLDDIKAGRPLGLHRLDIKSVTWQGKIIDIVLNVPAPPIVIDTTWVTATVNYGFDLWDSGGNLVDTITSVAVAGPDRIRIVCSATPPSGTRLTNAWGRPADAAASGRTAGPRSNIRDSEGLSDSYVDSNGVTRYLHNYLVILDTVKP